MSIFGPTVNGRDVSVRELADGFDARAAAASAAAADESARMEEMHQRARTQVLQDQQQLSVNEAAIERLEEHIKEQADILKEAVSAFDSKESEHAIELSTKKKELTAYKEHIVLLKSELHATNESRDMLKAQVELNQREEIERMNEETRHYNEMTCQLEHEINAMIKNHEAEKEELSTRTKTLEQRVERMREQLAFLTRDNEKLQANVSRLTERLNASQTSLASCEALKDILEERLEDSADSNRQVMNDFGDRFDRLSAYCNQIESEKLELAAELLDSKKRSIELLNEIESCTF
jgi:chromosome segregation ATPase